VISCVCNILTGPNGTLPLFSTILFLGLLHFAVFACSLSKRVFVFVTCVAHNKDCLCDFCANELTFWT